MSIFMALPVILVAIVLHEALGHKLVAEILGLKPTFIAIGVPITFKRLNTVYYVWKRKTGIPIVFSWLLIGGGVGYDDTQYYSTKMFWQKIVMILAGPFVNVLVSFLAIMVFTNAELAMSIVNSYALMTLEVIKSIFTPQILKEAVYSHEFVEVTFRLARTTPHWYYLANFSLWNVSIAVMNMLPVPGLDGGQLIGITIIRMFGEKAIKPVKIISAVGGYTMIAISVLVWIWWIVSSIF